MRPMIKMADVSKVFTAGAGRELTALSAVSFEVNEHEFITVLGASGCGKTTLLNILAGFESPSSGSVVVAGQSVDGPSVERGVVFQEYALFPWLSVRANIGYGLREKRVPKSQRQTAVNDMLELTGLENVEDHYPAQLSGGMKQRVSLARVLVNDPKLLLLDEPFGALDEQRRIQMQDELLRIWQRDRKTALFVTHSIDEAIVLGDRILIMTPHPGRVGAIVEVDLPRPRNRTSDEFNILRRSVTDTLWGGGESPGHAQTPAAKYLEASG